MARRPRPDLDQVRDAFRERAERESEAPDPPREEDEDEAEEKPED